MKFWINQTPPKNNFSGSRLFLLKALSFYGNPKQKLSFYHVPILCYRNSHERVQLPISTSIYLPAHLEFLLFVFLFSKHNLAKSFKVFKMSSSFAEVLSLEVVKNVVKPVELVVPVVLGIPDLEVKTDFKPQI
jgi:hypothetical protein